MILCERMAHLTGDIRTEDVWKWLNKNKEKIAINTETNVLALDEVIWCVKDDGLIIKTKEFEK